MEKNNFSLENFSLNHNYVIEASAGTGKTHSIVEITKKIVKEFNIGLDKMLIVTYTEKAAGELKDRIRSGLEDVRNANVDNASIFTIHSFCKSIIDEFGITANLPLNLSLVDETKMRDFAKRYIRKGNILDDITLVRSKEWNVNTGGIIDALVSNASKYYLNSDFEEDDSIVSFDKEEKIRIETYLNILKAGSFEEALSLNDHLNDYFNELINSTNKNFQKYALKIKEAFDNKEGFTSSKAKPTNEDEKKALDFFEGVADLNPHLALAGKYLKDFYIKWQEEKEHNKVQTFDDMIRYVREKILSPDTLLKEKLQEKYYIAIIDEFQDTNQRQFDIFKALFMDDNHRIIVVGDPKQSIYAFQGADVDVYKKAVKEISNNNGVVCRLSKNYRSSKSMVNSCNKLFDYYDFFEGESFEPSLSLDKDILNEKGEFDKEHEARYLDEQVQAFWIAENNICKDDETIQSPVISDDQFARIVVEQIIDCTTKINGHTKLQIKDARKDKDFRDVTFSDFTVLSRTGSEMIPIQRELKRVGIPYIRYKDPSLFKGIACAHTIAILEAINSKDFTGKNRLLFKKAMFTKFFGYALEELSLDYFNHDDIPEMDLILKWKELAGFEKYEDLFDSIIEDSKLLEKSRTLKELQNISEFKQLADYCINYLYKGYTLDNLIRNLNNALNFNIEDENSSGIVVEKNTDFDSVKIMTIHASKGLQFPVVIAACGYRKPVKGGNSFTYHEDGKQILSINKNSQYAKEVEAEWKRLFYVAYTRAQFVMILPNYNQYGMPFLGISLDKYLDENKEDYRLIFKEEFEEDEYITIKQRVNAILNAEQSIYDNSIPRENFDELIKESKKRVTYKHSYSSLSHDKVMIEEIDEEGFLIDKEGEAAEKLSKYDLSSIQIDGTYDGAISPIEIPADYPKGSAIGTALHEVFEKLTFTNYEEDLESLIIKCFKKQNLKINDNYIEATKLIVSSVMNAYLPEIKGYDKTYLYFKLKEIDNINLKREIEFNFNALGERLHNYLNGFIDLIFKRGEYYSILDWKSDSLSDEFLSYSDSKELKKHIDDKYSIQRVLYAYCLIKWLKQAYPSLSEQEIFNNHFGGVYYVCIKGCNSNTSNGIYSQTWNSWDDLKRAFDYIINTKMWKE